MEFIDIAGVKRRLNIQGTGRDTALQPLVDAVNDYMGSYLGRDWDLVARTQEAHWADGCNDTIVLNHYPATTLTDLSVDGIVWDVTDDKKVVLDGAHGFLVRTDGLNWPDTHKRPVILVSYTGGPGSTVPDAILLAGYEMVAWLYQTPGGRTVVGSGGLHQTTVSSMLTDLPGVAEALAIHRDPAKGFLR